VCVCERERERGNRGREGGRGISRLTGVLASRADADADAACTSSFREEWNS
jgi:hypothetical protein